MLKACEQTGDKSSTSLVQHSELCTKAAGYTKYLTAQVFFVRSLCTGLEQLKGAYEQLFLGVFNPLGRFLCPLYTGPITNTILIKE
jgi:hypothetical protein